MRNLGMGGKKLLKILFLSKNLVRGQVESIHHMIH